MREKKRNGTSLAFPLGRLALLRARTHRHTHTKCYHPPLSPHPAARSLRSHTCCPFYFHIDSGSKSSLRGMKHWHWRAALATKTDGNPPANPCSSRPIITSQWPRAASPEPALTLLPRLLSWRKKEKKRRRRTTLPLDLITISKISQWNQCTRPCVWLVEVGGDLCVSVCNESPWKWRPWKAKQCISEIQSTAELHWL